MNYNNLVYLYDSKDEFSPGGDNRTMKGHPDTKENECGDNGVALAYNLR